MSLCAKINKNDRYYNDRKIEIDFCSLALRNSNLWPKRIILKLHRMISMLNRNITFSNFKLKFRLKKSY